MYEIQTTADFDLWFKSLADMQAKARINARLRRVQLGQLGDVRHVGENVAEFRFFFVQGTVFISYNINRQLLCYWLVVINRHSTKILPKQNNLQVSYEVKNEPRTQYLGYSGAYW